MDEITNDPLYNSPDSMPTTTRCRLLLIPDDLNVVAAVNDALAGLASLDLWRPSVAVSAQDVVSSLLKMMLEDDCMTVCDDLEWRIEDDNLEVKCGDGDWESIGPVVGSNGVDGREIQVQATATHIQWRYVGDAAWINIVSLASLTGPTGAGGATGASGPKIIGTIIPYASTSAPSGCLPCDGTVYLKSDYPALVAVLNAVFFTDATHFKTPDLRDRTMIGTGGNNGNGAAIGAGLTARSMGGIVGAETHQLTASEMPSHAHTIGAYVSGGGSGSQIARTTTPTSLGAFAVSSNGGDGAHNNMQPSLAIGFCIVAA